MLHLGAVEGSVDRERRNHIGAVKNTMVLFDVVEFDGETVGGGPNLVFRQQEGCRVTLLPPPAEDRFSGAQLRGRDLPEHAEDVVVGKFLIVVAGRRGAVENH